jgi:hypothetical protein
MTAGLPVQRALNATPASSTQRPQNAVGEPVAGAGAGAAGAAGTPAGPPGAGATSTVVAGATGPPGPTGMTRGIPKFDPVQTWTWMLQPMDWGITQHVALNLKGI